MPIRDSVLDRGYWAAMSEENVETVRRCYEFWAKRDYSFIEDVVHPDGSIDLSRNELNPDIYRGYDGFLRWVRSVEEVWDQFTVVPDEFIDGGDHVFVAVRISGEGKGSGVEVDMRIFNVWTFRDGKVWRVAGGYRDRDQALEAAGLRE
jgi:ketosteroid isomerase-like protein